MDIKNGYGRKVFIFKHFVIKVPKNLFGFISNITEVYRHHKYKYNDEINSLLCPILFHDPLCFFVIMPRAEILSKEEFNKLDSGYIYELFDKYYNYSVMQDIKSDNFGYYQDRLVKIDYGDDYCIFHKIKYKIY